MVNRGLILMCAATAALAACIPEGRVPPPRAAASDRAPTRLGPLLETDDGALVAPPRPTWDDGAVVRRSRDVAGGAYIVRGGDTLRTIGNRSGAGSEAIAAANGLAPPYTIYPGQKLAIPGGQYHDVAAGETGIAIAQAYGVRWADMVGLNSLDEPYILRIGQRLRVPAGARAAAASLPAATADQAQPDLERRAAVFSVGIDDIVTGSQPALAEGRRAASASARPGQVPLKTAIAQPKAFDGGFAWPLRGRILSGFGSNDGGRINDGINIAAAAGTPVLAAGSGVVAYSGDEIGVFGGLVLIDHGDGWITAYGHLGKLDMVRGEKVAAGQPIGAVGQTGYVSEPQLHFEIRQKRQPVDPRQKLPSI